MSFGRQTHEIELRAKDGASNTFRMIGREGEAAMKKIDTAAQRTGRSMADAKRAGANLAIGAGALTGALTLAARAAAEEEATFRRLETAVEATGASYDQYAKQIDTAVSAGERLSFADDQVADALARMIGITGDTTASLDAMGVAMDFARLRNIDLSTSADLIGKALAGNTTALSRYGVVIEEGATATEILAAIQAKAAGQAVAYADSTQGGIDRVRNSIDNYIESIGAWSGVTGQALATASDFTVQLALMGVGIGKTAQGIKGLAGAAGIAGLATGPVGLGVLAGAAIAAGAAFLILRDDAGSLESQLASLDKAQQSLRESTDAAAAAGAANALIYDALTTKMEMFGATIETAVTTRRDVILASLDEEQQKLADLEEAWRGPAGATEEFGQKVEAQRQIVAGLVADLTELDGAAGLVADSQLALAEIMTHTGAGAADAQAMVVALFKAYERGAFGAVGSAEAINKLADVIILTADNLPEYDRQLLAAAESTDALGESAERTTQSIGVLFTGTKELSDRLKAYDEGGERAALTTNLLGEASEFAGKSVAKLSDVFDTAKEGFAATPVRVMSGDLHNLAGGFLTAAGAAEVFKGTQDGLISAQSVYSQQQSEYQSQLGSLQEAEDLLNQRRADGVALTAEQEDFLNRVNAAQERLTGGVEDATIAEGMLALQYAENVRVGDQLNTTMQGQQVITGQLIELVQALILSLDGIPEDVKTQIELIGADTAIGQAASLSATLAGIPPQIRSEIVVGIQGGALPFGGLFLQHGGMVPASQHGRLLGPISTVNEAGGEMLVGGQGGMVIPNSATRAHLREQGGRGGDTFNIYAPLTIVANDPLAFADQMRSHAVSGGR